MKRLISIFFLTIYTGSAPGVVFDFHYCGPVFTHISVLDIGGHVRCNSNRIAMPRDCCKNKLICLKIESQKVSQLPVIVKPIIFPVDSYPMNNGLRPSMAGERFRPTYHYYFRHRSSPRPIYILNRVFRF